MHVTRLHCKNAKQKNFNSSRKGILLPPRQHLGLLYGEGHEISRRKVFTGMVASFRKQLLIDLYVASFGAPLESVGTEMPNNHFGADERGWATKQTNLTSKW